MFFFFLGIFQLLKQGVALIEKFETFFLSSTETDAGWQIWFSFLLTNNSNNKKAFNKILFFCILHFTFYKQHSFKHEEYRKAVKNCALSLGSFVLLSGSIFSMFQIYFLSFRQKMI